MKFKDKYESYLYHRDKLENHGFNVSDYRDINYGLQFKIEKSGKDSLIRIYESKKNGIRIDTSQVKDKDAEKAIFSALNLEERVEKTQPVSDKVETPNKSDIEGNSIIGTDESGKGDYFGPLVVAGVFADEKDKKILREIGVDDSKKISDANIKVIAAEIKNICSWDILTLNNLKYNELYFQIANLNKLLAWGHARTIENLLEKVECEIVLSDQFGNPDLIRDALMKKGKKVHLEQRPRAEENVVVAAASIIARDEFIRKMDELSEKYGMIFPKGASKKTISAGREFVSKYGKSRLNEVSKLHFKTTDAL